MTTNSTTAEGRLAKLGIKLPTPPEPFGTYVEAVQTGNLLFLTGMLPPDESTKKSGVECHRRGKSATVPFNRLILRGILRAVRPRAADTGPPTFWCSHNRLSSRTWFRIYGIGWTTGAMRHTLIMK